MICHGYLRKFENLPRSGDTSFVNAKDLLNLRTMLGGSWDVN